MNFKFIGMTEEEAKPFVYPAVRALGKARGDDSKTGGSWKHSSYIRNIQEGGGIGSGINGCKTWSEGLTEQEARELMLKPDPPFCSWDSTFDTSMKYRALVMRKMSDRAIHALIERVLMAPLFEKGQTLHPWWFYLQVDPTNGFAANVAPDATAYPWRFQDSMTLQVIAKWPENLVQESSTLMGFNELLISALQPYVGSDSYYNYADEDMPGGAVPLLSYFGPNAAALLDARNRYSSTPLGEGTKWFLDPVRRNEGFGIQPWTKPQWFAVVGHKDVAGDARKVSNAAKNMGLVTEP
mmetsp:Transcript_97056/g.190580  ORF Transcript_97056/g.190580 Transcript_97056/m.190580 type:complete len:296 (+) Transcript_97056:3-890(+)